MPELPDKKELRKLPAYRQALAKGLAARGYVIESEEQLDAFVELAAALEEAEKCGLPVGRPLTPPAS